MLKLRLAVGMAGWGLPLDKTFAAAAQLGLAAVEIDARRDLRPEELSETGVRHIRKLLGDARLQVAAVRFRSRRGYAVQTELDARVEAAKRAMGMAYALGARWVVGNVGAIPPKDDSDEHRLLVEVLGDLGRYGQRVGAGFVAETEQDDATLLVRLLDAVDDPLVGAALNAGNLVLAGIEPHVTAEALGTRVQHVYLSDAITGDRRRGLVPLGQGDVDFPALLAALERRDYRGYFTLCEADAAQRPVHEWTAAMAYLRRL